MMWNAVLFLAGAIAGAAIMRFHCQLVMKGALEWAWHRYAEACDQRDEGLDYHCNRCICDHCGGKPIKVTHGDKV